ncbi:hypothetical protein BD769DRAFT_1678978 [Suillus cothurnatus]|nr:hypothetical protein BD769DRAFT_1678978 [Suillus cothurnatus]
MSIFGGWDDFKAQCKTNVLYAHAILQRVDEPTVILDVKNWMYPLPRTSVSAPRCESPSGQISKHSVPLRTFDGFNICSLSLIDDSSQQDFAVRQHHTLKESKILVAAEACGTSLVEMSHVIGFAKLSSQMAKTMSLRGPLDIEQLVVDMIDGLRIEYFAHLLVIPKSEIGLKGRGSTTGMERRFETATERENLGIWARDSLATREGALRRGKRERRGSS